MENVNTDTYRDSKDRLRCERRGKIAFYDEWRASDIADRAMRQDRYLRVYYESACGYWHLLRSP